MRAVSVPDTTAERILQAVRAWLKAAAVRGDALDDAQVIPADAKGPRPDLPYLTVKLTVHDVVEGSDEGLDDCADSLTMLAGAVGTVYSLTANGVSVSYTSVAGDTTSTIATALGARLRADALTVAAGAAGTVYSFRVDGDAVSYTRLLADTDTTVATALAALANALDGVFAASSGAVVYVGADVGTVAVTSVSATLTHVASRIHAHVDGAVVYAAAISGTLTLSGVSVSITRVADAVPVRNVNAQRSGTLSVQGFGAATAAWLERCVLRLEEAAIATALDAAGLTVDALGGLTNVAALIDTSIEPRFLREFSFNYALRTEPEVLVPLASVLATTTYERFSGSPDPIVDPILAPTGY